MSNISTYLQHIASKVYAKDVRTAIVNAISQCYNDVNAPALQTEAMQAAVQAKIDAGEMAALTIADGSITGAKLADGTITADKLASDVTLETDTTLTQSGMPADAKVTGDRISKVITIIDYEIAWERGTINVNNGTNYASTVSCRSVGYITYSTPIIVRLQDGAKFSWRLYDASGNFISTSDFISDDTTKLVFEEGQRVRFTCGHVNSSVMPLDEVESAISISSEDFTDATLTKKDKAADAYAVGVKIEHVEDKVASVEETLRLDEDVEIPAADAGNGMIGSSGDASSSSSNYNHTDYINVSAYAKIRYAQNTYTSSTSAGMAFYNANKELVKFIAGYGSDSSMRYRFKTVDVPTGATYARFSTFLDKNTYGEFELYGVSKLYDAIGADEFSSRLYKNTNNVSVVSESSAVFDLYDALLAKYPEYITKNTLTDSGGGFVNYEYVFSTGKINDPSKSYTYPVDAEIEKPIVLLSSGMHGYERSAVMSLYSLLHDVCANPENFNGIVENAVIKVMPVVCPSGFDNNSRVNSNGVNINRNFNTSDWTYDSSAEQNSGQAPADQAETRVYQNWIGANDDAFAHVDIHNSEIVKEISVILSNNSAYKKLFVSGVQNLTSHFAKDRDISRSTNIYFYTARSKSTTHGTATKYAEEAGIENTATFELSWNVDSTGKHSDDTISVGAEIIGNFLIALGDWVSEAIYGGDS